MTAALRDDLQRVIDDLDAVDRAVDALSSQTSDEQFFWQPNAGTSWSIGQCLEHLAITNKIYGDAIGQGIAQARAGGLTGGDVIAPTFFGRQFIGLLEPPSARRFRAPRRVQPATSSGRAEILRAFRVSHDLVREHVREASGIDVNRARFTNPFFPIFRLRVGTGLRIIPAHDRRHVWQAENVRKAPGFPSGR